MWWIISLGIPENSIFQLQTPLHSVYLFLMTCIMLYLELHSFSFIVSWWLCRASHCHLSAKHEGNEAENQGWIRNWILKNYGHPCISVPFMEAGSKIWLMEQDTLNPYRAYVRTEVHGETWSRSGRKLIKGTNGK